MIIVAQCGLGILLALIVYHHVGYPAVLRAMAKRQRARGAQAPVTPLALDAALPAVTLIVPAHNEADVIVAKLANIAALTYPRDRLSIVIALDGCTDDTRALVQASLPRLAERLQIQMIEYAANIGKVAVLNDQIAAVSTPIVALSDTSAAIDADALLRAAAHFADRSVGVVCGSYRLKEAGSEGERAYWTYQSAIKSDEAAVAAPMGAHGAFYLFRRDVWEPLPADTINDDFVLPMRIVARGYRAVYDAAISAVELERTRTQQEFRRRVRIGAGNLQQVLWLPQLADPRRGALAFVYLSGKALRPFIPLMAGVAGLITAALAIAVPGAFYKVLFALGSAVMGAIVYVLRHRDMPVPRLLRWLAYLVEGHAASGLGALKYMTGTPLAGWQPPKTDTSMPTVLLPRPFSMLGEPDLPPVADGSFLKPEVSAGKRVFDIIVASIVFVVLAVLFIPIALAIKLESAGPVFYRQRRVGRITSERSETFQLIKFRSMRQDAETSSGAVWAVKNDPRITRIGWFLRKTRLDELPQCINVLQGDMSVVGPRPERPGFFPKLEAAVPFYVERTFGLRPGITGLAQVNLPYDESIDDVRMKCVYDHAYATRLTSFGEWLKTDIGIMLKTFQVMALGKGQ